MFLPEKPRPIDFYKEGASASTAAAVAAERGIMIEVVANGSLQPHHHHLMILGETSRGGEDHEVKAAPKKRAETWVREETRCLISFRREVDGLFNTFKSNKHLWEQISSKMREKGFDRSPTMCTDKWKNLLKEFKKARHSRDRAHDGVAALKMSYHKELDDLLRDRPRNGLVSSSAHAQASSSSSSSYTSSSPREANSYIQFSAKAGKQSTVTLERQSGHDDDDPLPITSVDAVAPNGVPPWNQREASGNETEDNCKCGRVISVKYGEYTRRIGINGTANAIEEAIKSAFRLRTKRAFWLEDGNHVVRSLGRDMPLGNYNLRIDEGMIIKLCHYDDSDCIRMEEKTLYTEDDLSGFLARRGFSGVRELSGYRTIDNLAGQMYHGVRLVGD